MLSSLFHCCIDTSVNCWGCGLLISLMLLLCCILLCRILCELKKKEKERLLSDDFAVNEAVNVYLSHQTSLCKIIT